MNTQAAHAWLEQQPARMVADLVALCNQNSGSSNLAGLNRVADQLADWMAIEPARLSRIELPLRHQIDDRGNLQSQATGPLLRWDYQPQSQRRVLLAIHYDTVFGPSHDFQQCQQVSETQLRGPGVADAKGGIVVLRYALQAIIKFALADELGWTVVLNPDEELGSPSSATYFQDLAPEFDFGLLFEPALPSGTLVSQRKGSGNFTVVVHGRSAHAGRHFEEGRNALAEASRLAAALDSLNGLRDGTTINIGHISGGGPVNIVPDLGIVRLNVRVADDASSHWFEEAIRSRVQAIRDRDGFAAELHGSFQSPPKLITEAQQNLIHCVECVGEKLGVTTRWQATGGVCDGNKLAAAGLPNIDTLGPIGEGLHSSLETVQVRSLVDKAKTIVEILAGFAAGQFPRLARKSRA